MQRRLAVLVVYLAGVVFPAAGARADNPVLVATVGSHDAFNISLKDAAGNVVRHLDPGTYTIQVHDRSRFHNFHLMGPGVDMSTTVDEVVDTTWTVTFTNGAVYTFQCDPHRTVMNGTLASNGRLAMYRTASAT